MTSALPTHPGFATPTDTSDPNLTKEMFHLTTHSIHFIYGYMASANLTKEMFHLTTHSTHFIYGYMASVNLTKEMFHLTTHSMHFYLRLCSVRHMVKDHSDSEERKEMFYLTMHSTHFIYNYVASGIW